MRQPWYHLATPPRTTCPLGSGRLWGPTSRSFGGKVLVFQFPNVIHRMKRGVPNQEPERPRAGRFALGMQRPNCMALGVAMRVQSLVGRHRILKREHAEFLGPAPLRS